MESNTQRTTETRYQVLAAYDISLSVDGEKIQPAPGNPLEVSISDPAISDKLRLQVWHIRDDGTGEQIPEFTVEGESVRFLAESFSAYLVVKVTLSTIITAGDGNTYRVSVTYDQDAEMPENADLAVRELGDDEKEDYVNQSAEALGTDAENLAFARAFDISLTDPDTGMEVQPASGVRVSVSLLDISLNSIEELRLLHFGEEVETVSYTLNGSAVEFETDGFSVYVLAGYTVDFHWGDYTYSIAGESEILLSALLEKLGVTEITAADVAEVAFSDPALVEVETIKDEAEQTSDWQLRSLAPFSTEEKLTLTLKNGRSVEIKVTDADDPSVIGSWPCNAASSDNVTCTLYSNGDMVISGTGSMKDYTANPWVKDTPWYKAGVMDQIQRVVITDGITHLGTNTFTRAGSLTEIDASSCTTLTNAGNDLFKVDSGTSHLTRVDFSGNTNFTGFGTNAFQNVNTIQYIDISNTQLTGNILSNTTAGFGASKTAIVTLKANNCSKLTSTDLSGHTSLTTLDLSGCTGLTSLTVPSGLTTLDVSGSGLTSLDVSACTGLTTLNVSNCANLTELTVPSSVTTLNVSGSGLTTLDISGCENLDLLDLSTCASLTTVKVGDRDDLKDLSWLTLPNSVTTLDASGFTSLTSVDVPASVTSLNISGCTGLIVLDLSQTSLTSIDVSNDTALMALKVPATVTTLNTTGCSEDLVIYFDGKRASFPDGLLPESAICWGDCTYEIARNAEVSLGEIFTDCGITAITSTDVDSLSASDPSVLEISGLNVKNLKAFTEPQKLTVNLKNSLSGDITVNRKPLEESNNLNEFLDENTEYSYQGNTYPISKPLIMTDGNTLNLTMSFSEIPEEQEGERQMKLLSPMKYTFPAGLAVTGVSSPVTLNLQGGESVTAAVTLETDTETGAAILTVTADASGQEAAVSASDTVSFTIPVTVQVNEVPHDYELGNGLTLSAVKSHNVKVSSFEAGNYSVDQETGTITVTYTVVVEAENDLDFDGKEYAVSIADSTNGDVSGNYTYAHKEGFVLPDGKPASQVNGTEVEPGVTLFTGFPLTVAHMYEGDTITLTYTAKPQNRSYDWNAKTATVQNTVTISNSGNPSNDPEDDSATAATENIPYTYTPLTREYVTQDGSWAYWRVTVNPDGYTLNDGSPLTLADTFDDGVENDARQSIDYASVVVSDGSVTYDYSGSTGTFVIPDSTPVTIIYRTRITAQPGEAAYFRGTARLKDSDGNVIASATAGAIDQSVVIYPSPSDVGGFGDNFMVKLFVYAEGEMQEGIKGAQFILLDANQRALEYKEGENKEQPVTFTTGDDGYVNIELHEEDGDVSIEKNTGYYLEMMQAVSGYQKDNTLYSFMITDDPAYSSGGFYKYYNGDTMKVRLYPATAGLSVSIRFSGSYALREDQQNAVTAVLQMQDEYNNWVEVERHTYADTKSGSIKFEEQLYDETQNIYRVVEENQSPWDLPEDIVLETTYYCLVNTASSDPQKQPQEFIVSSADDSVNVVIDNRYEEPQLTIIKMDKSTGATLPGAEFSVYKIVNGAQTGGVVTTYTTDDAGQLVIRGGESFESETLYGIKETKAPEKYLLPLNDEWHYFYFCNDEYLEPSILANLPEGATAVNLTNNGDRVTIGNQEKTITVPVMKLWQGAAWPNNDDVLIGLYQSVAGSEPEPVLNEDGTPRQVTLTKSMPYNNTAFTELPSRDSQDRNIVYSIKEESISGEDPLDARYNQEYGISSAGVYIVRNKPATALTVSKEWYDLAGTRIEDEELPAQSPVTFDVYRSSVPFEDSTPEDGVTNADMMAFVRNLVKVRENLSFGDPAWKMSIRDLDKQDDLGAPYYYYVLETVPSFGNELYVLDEDNGRITIQNKTAPEIVKLTVTKAALVDDPRQESLDRDFEFTLKLKEDDAHPIRSWKVYTDEEHPENDLVTDWDGEVKFTLKPTNPAQQPTPGASITLSLPAGVTASVTETYNAEYTVETAASVAGTTTDNGRTFTYDTGSTTDPVTLTYTNTLHVICKVVKSDETLSAEERNIPFESLKSALNYIRENQGSFTSPWTIYMLEDYTIPVTDVVDVQADESLTLTTAATDDPLFPFKGGEESDRAVITRGGVGDSMLKNAGTLTLDNIVLDGAKDSNTATGNGGLVNSTGVLNLNDKTTLRNSAASGKGGAVYAEGTVNIVDGVVIGGNSAPSASALYLKGTLNMSGGSITGNTGASDGAVVAESSGDVVNLSGSPVIFENTYTKDNKAQAANLYIGVDSDNIINVVYPGLSETAHIGVTAMEGHMLIGEQFATAGIGFTEHLNRFVNDVYGYRGKLKDGTSTNIVWDGLTIIIQKEVDPVGANENDRFTITLSSPSIVMSTYIIDGTLDYTITPARLNRPGRITLRNIKASDVIKISPLPVGEYTISEEASNYNPTYTVVETGSSDVPTEIDDGKFTADNNSTVTVTNTRRLADIKLTKTLDDRLAGDAEVDFAFTVKLTDVHGTTITPIAEFPLAEGITTNASGEATFEMLPTDAVDAIKNFKAPVGATMTITETVNPNYKITVSGHTTPSEGENAAIENLNTDDGNVFSFRVTDAGAAVTFENKRKMAEIVLSKTLVGKVSKEESFTFTLTLTNGTTPVANYVVYRDEINPENNITTNENGVATIILKFGENETEPKSIPLTIPDGTKLVVAETEVKKDVGGTQKAIYNTTYSVNGAAAVPSAAVTIDSVSETDESIAFTNTRKTNTIVVKNTVNGYSGNVVPFTFTATVTDGGENAYNDNGFENGVMTFKLITDQTQLLTVPYGATLTVAETFIVGYSTTVKRGGAAAVEALSDTFVVSANMPSSLPLLFTNKQLIGLQLVNHTSSKLENVKVTVEKDKIYRVNSDRTGQELIGSNKTATLSVAAGETVVLEIEHDTSKMDASQSYTVNGTTPAIGYYYTVNNEPSFHEYADPAILRVYDAANYEVKGKLRYSVQDSIVTFTEQPLVSFETNGGEWTTAMEDYHWDNVHKVYQKAVVSGETVARPAPDPIYPTAERITFLGWTAEEAFAKASHTAGEDISAHAYDFNTLVTAPVTLYAVWAKPARDERVVTVKNGHTESLNVTATLTQNGTAVVDYPVIDGQATDANGKVSFTLTAGESKNLTVLDGVKLVLGLEKESLAVSSEYILTASADNKTHTIDSVTRDGTVTFIPGICKITDSDGNVLYDSNGKPAVYGKLSDAFTAYAGTLYTDASHVTVAAQAAVKMLVDEYEISSKHTFPNKKMTLTTAGKDDDDFPFLGIQDRATLYRDSFTADSLFAHTNASEITLSNIILDGRNVPVGAISGGLINVNKIGAKLTIETGTTMQNVVFAEYAATTIGGAIYVNNGTLEVDACLFSNLHARNGGAIYVDSKGSLNISGTDGTTRFEECCAEVSGGAIEYRGSSNLTLNGGSDNGFKVDENGNTQFNGEGKKIEVSNPGIVFFSCTAKNSDEGNGGAIFIQSSGTVSIQGCSFAECSARVNKNDDRTRGGGAIAAKSVNSITVSNCTFSACDTLTTGGAVFAKIKDGTSMTVNNCIFRNDSCKGQGGGIGVYQNNENASTTALLTVNGCSFENCSSGTQNGSGGAIQSYLPCMSLNNSEFSDCWAGKEGGGINNYFGNNYTQQWSQSYLNMSGCTFTRCRAEDRFQVDIVVHYGGALNTKANTVNVDDCEFVECVSTLRDGGALHLGGCGAGSSATISNSTFTSCTAKKHGGAVFSSAEKLEVSGSTFYGCQSTADNGGAVYHGMNCRSEQNVKKETKITNCEFKQGCGAAINGSAVWTAAQSAVITGCTIEGCTTGNSGAIYLSDKDVKINTSGNKETGTSAISVPMPSGALTRATLAGGSITGCQAVSGSAVYVGNSALFSGDLSVTGNNVTGANGGAIQTSDAATTQPADARKLYFEGNVVVEDNTSGAEANDHDVLMQINGNTIINTTENGLGSGAHIGVYVPGVDGDNIYGKHGKYSQPFGTYHDSDAGCNFLDAFFNNRDSELYGYQGDTYIHWGFYVCKITDAEGNTLKRTNGRDAVYQQLSQAVNEFTSVKTESGETDKAVYIKMLVENYAVRQDTAITNFPAADITLTTASKSDTDHPYRGTEGTFSTIYRTNSENPLFSVGTDNAVFQLKDITLDGRRNDKTATEGAYKLITSTAGEIIVNSGTTLQYAKAENGAAITGVQVTINGRYDTEKKEPTVKITNCTATGSGGAISTQNLTITNAEPNAEGKYGTSFTGCSAQKGGAIYATGTAVSMAGASFTDCQSTGEGGVLFHNYSNDTGTESAATAITNCAFNDSEATGGEGGAVSSKAGTLTVEGSSFDTVKASGNGGAISHTGSTAATITGTTFKACRTTGSGFGGSVYTGAKVVTLNGGSFENSTAANHGGALYCASSADGSAATVSGTSFKNCSTTLSNGDGGAIYANGGTLTLKNAEDKTAVKIDGCMTSTANGAVGRGGAVYMNAGVLNVTKNTVISACYADKGGAIYLPAGVTMNITDSPEFSQNGFTTINGHTVDASEGACIYLAQGGRINFKDSPKFSRNILPNKPRVTNGGVTDFVRQDVYMAGYQSDIPYDTNAASIYIVGELTGDTIWVWPEQDPHKKPNTQFAKIDINGEPLSDEKLAETLSHFRNALADGKDVPPNDYNHTECDNGEYLAGVQVGEDYNNVYWDKMYVIEFKKKDNKGVAVPDAEFTLYKELACTTEVAKAVSADGETDTDAQGKLLARGTVEFTSIRIGAYYMKETKTPTSFKENDATYLVLVGTPYLSPNEGNKYLWVDGGPLDVADAATLVARYTTGAGKYYGIFPLDENNKAVLRANIASSNVGIENIRNDFEVRFMKLDGNGLALPGAEFTVYTQVLDSDDQPAVFEDGYPQLMLWSRDGETYPAPVVSADGTAKFKDKDNRTLPKGMVYFRELPLGTYFLLETAYPERNGDNRRAFFVESDRVFKLEVEEDKDDATKVNVTLSEWEPNEADLQHYEELDKNKDGYYVISNKEVVCKLTDGTDHLLYSKGHTVWEKGTENVRLFPAIYPTLEGGFAAAQTGTFFYADGSSADVDALKLQMLKDYTLKEAVVYSNSSRKLTFTTAGRTAKTADRYIFSTNRTSDPNRARIYRGYDADTSADANAGALITLASGADMTVQNIRLIGQKTSYNGRAIHVTEESSLTFGTSARIEYFKQEAAADSAGASNVRGGAILLDDGTSLTINGGYNRTAIFADNEINNKRTEGNTDSDGGAIAVGADCTVSITNAQFGRNNASAAAPEKGNGGAVSINGTQTAGEQVKLQVYNVVFSRNTASYKGGAIRAAENCDLTISNCTFNTNYGNRIRGNGGEGGAIAVLSDKDNPSTLTINNGTTFANNRAEYGGAVKIGGYGTLTLDNVTMQENVSHYGGAVSVAPGAQATLTNGTITGNTATTYGGAFYVEGKKEEDNTVTSGSLTINGGSVTSNTAANTTNTVANGGAIYAANYAAVTVNGGSITGNTASATSNTASANGGAIYAGEYAELTVTNSSITSNTATTNGGAIYAADYAEVTVTGGSITGNKASGTDGGAINVGGLNAKLHFGGSPFIFDNLSNVENDEQQRNVVLNVLMEVDPSRPIKGIINTTADGLSENALIGVYVTDEVFMVHGLPGEPFGIFGDMPDRVNPQVFRNDRALALYGTRNADDPSDVAIYWNDVICKLTVTDDKLLYQDVIFTINGKETKYKSPAVYTSIQDGFNAAQGTLYTRSGSTYSEFDSAKAGALKLKMLRDVTLTDQLFVDRDAYGILYEGSRRVTFTTAETTINNDMISAGDFFTFSTTRTGSLAERALIKRNFEALSMLYAMGPQLTLTDIILDGANENNASAALGGIALVSDKAELVIRQGAVLRNSRSTLSGGAVHVASGGALTMTGGEIIGNSAAYGGAVYVAPNASMTMANEVLNGIVLRGTINGNTATTNGAGVYLTEGSRLYLSGSPYFGGTGTSDASGANPAATISGPLYDASGMITNGNYLNTALSNATNGQLVYNRARQDIYVAGFADSGSAARSIVVTGAVDMNPGSLWTWCEQQEHYEMLKQFAVFESNAVKTAIQNAGSLERTMRVFRNAQLDLLTGCGADYLSGQEGDDINGLKCIYWTGGFDFVFEKIDGSGKTLNGATFTLYKANAAGTDILKENGVPVAYKVSGPDGKIDATAISKSVEKKDAVTIKYSADGTTIRDVALYGDGLVTFEKIPPATYFLVETTFPTINGKPYTASQEKYRIVLDGKGLYIITVEKDDDGKATWTKAAITTSFADDGSGSYTRSDNPGQNPVNVFEVMNLSPAERKVILRKVTKGTYAAIENAEFQIERFDRTLVEGKAADGSTTTTFTSTASGVYFIDKLPYGIYYLQENKPNTVRFTLTVGDDSDTAPGSRDGVVIKGPN